MKIYIQKVGGELYGIAYINGKTYTSAGANHTAIFNHLLAKSILKFND